MVCQSGLRTNTIYLFFFAVYSAKKIGLECLEEIKRALNQTHEEYIIYIKATILLNNPGYISIISEDKVASKLQLRT